MSTKEELTRGIRTNFRLELFNSFQFGWILFFVLSKFEWQVVTLLAYGLFLIIVILLQGQYYWNLKLIKLEGRLINQKQNLLLFKRMRRFNWCLISLMPICFVIQILFLQIDRGTLAWGVFVNLFGAAEFVNYYYFQLSIGKLTDLKYLLKFKRLKVSSLNKDLMANHL